MILTRNNLEIKLPHHSGTFTRFPAHISISALAWLRFAQKYWIYTYNPLIYERVRQSRANATHIDTHIQRK